MRGDVGMMQIHSLGPVGYCRVSRAVRLYMFQAVGELLRSRNGSLQ